MRPTAALAALAALLMLGGSALAAPADRAVRPRITPDPDVTPLKNAPVGAKARDRNGPEPLASPDDDIGMAPDPDEVPGGQVARPSGGSAPSPDRLSPAQQSRSIERPMSAPAPAPSTVPMPRSP